MRKEQRNAELYQSNAVSGRRKGEGSHWGQAEGGVARGISLLPHPKYIEPYQIYLQYFLTPNILGKIPSQIADSTGR